ncbi:MAG: double-strand break repair helicase AddA [Alphaproteobacteria bacterium]|nr:double-strand break repair helicase AddA [Alphaproteobacteria bacterium]
MTDQGAQYNATDPDASAWVAASAGTGKTHLLTDRVLRLLLAGCRPEAILCLTFTKAAAAELANRLNERLGEWAVAADDDLRDRLGALTGRPPTGDDLDLARRLFARVLDTPGGLKVQTIHSFCEALLRRFPLEADLAPHFQVMDERQAAEVLQGALDRVLAADTELPDPLVARLTALVDQQTFAELMAALSRERGRLRRLLGDPGGVDGLLAELRRTLGLIDDEDEASILAAAAAEPTFDGDGLRRVAAAMVVGGKTDQRRGQAIADWLSASERRVEGFDDYLGGFFTKDGQGTPFAKLLSKATAAALPEGEDILRAEIARLEAVRERRKAAGVAAATDALLRLGAVLIETYEADKRRQALLDYDDLVLNAHDLLLGRAATAWVLYKLDGGLDHILIDEAQDTNPEQWGVIWALAEEFFAGEGAREDNRTLFAVGDVKQSIYSFQRADPIAFQTMREHFSDRIAAAKRLWRPVELVRSYRSTPKVLEAVDAIFADPAASDGLDPDAAEIRHIPERRDDGGLVEIWPTEQPREAEEVAAWAPPVEQHRADSPVERLADRIAGRISRWLARGEVLEARGRPITPGDILILVQRRAPLVEAMVRALKRRRVAVAGIDRMVLTEQLPIMDLIALGKFLLLPDDDLNLAELLKSPLFGLDDGALFALAHERKGHLWQALAEHRRDDPAFAAAHEELAELLSRADFTPPFELYARLLGADGGRHRILGRLGPDANDPIDEFLDLALRYEAERAPSLQGFLHWLEMAETEVKRDQEQRRDEVRVMTVHGAKGLQAPIVFLADTVRVPTRTPVLLWPDEIAGEGAPLWAPFRDMEEAVADRARRQAIRERDQEYRRLFYVALTRAADRLYICGFEGKRGRPEGCWHDLAWRALAGIAEPFSHESGEGGLRLAEPPRRSPSAAEAADGLPPAGPPPDWLGRAPAPEPTPPRPLAPSRPDGEGPAVRSPLADDGRRRHQRGLHIHRLLQSLPDLPENERETAAGRYLALPAHGLEAAQVAEILAETLAVLADPGFRAIFGPGSRAEVALSGLLAGRAVTGQVDRLLVADSEVLVVDYKSNRPAPTEVTEVSSVYVRQMAVYDALLRRIYPEKTIRCALLWTDGPRLMPLAAGILAAHAP